MNREALHFEILGGDNMPPHPQPHYNNRLKSMVIGFALSTIVALIAGFALASIGIPVTVILPTLAPIWIGITTLTFMLFAE